MTSASRFGHAVPSGKPRPSPRGEEKAWFEGAAQGGRSFRPRHYEDMLDLGHLPGGSFFRCAHVDPPATAIEAVRRGRDIDAGIPHSDGDRILGIPTERRNEDRTFSSRSISARSVGARNSVTGIGRRPAPAASCCNSGISVSCCVPGLRMGIHSSPQGIGAAAPTKIGGCGFWTGLGQDQTGSK